VSGSKSSAGKGGCSFIYAPHTSSSWSGAQAQGNTYIKLNDFVDPFVQL